MLLSGDIRIRSGGTIGNRVNSVFQAERSCRLSEIMVGLVDSGSRNGPVLRWN